MKAVTFQGAKDIQVKEVEDPSLKKKDDIIVRITSTAICGSDLHIYQGALPAGKGYVIGHEPMGIVEEVGPEVNFDKYDDMGSYIKEVTGGGADVVIDCVGMDGKKSPVEAIEQKLKLQGGTLSAIQIALKAVRKFGTIQLTGVYGSIYNMFPLGNIFERNITLKMGQAPVIHYMPELFKKITDREFDPTEIISHRIPLDQASEAYEMFNNHQDECTKVILKP